MSPARNLTDVLRRLQDRLLRLLGNRVEARSEVVRRMLHRDANESVSYWLQLSVAVGIATLGLVVGSVAVVIGAMLIAPLMVPIIGLAMGLATGSPFLVLRSSLRVVFSVIVALAGACLITLCLPFHELNAEISARAAPTVLDLLTAAFCAIAGVYAALRPGSDTASTAAGTSIGISLVPPLCASGYGLGTASWSIAGGAALLFLTNLVAIVAIGSLAFFVAGFNRVDVTELERDELADGEGASLTRFVVRRLAGLFESKLGPALRLLMPFMLLALVYLPLRRALDEVAWEVKARNAVKAGLAAEPFRIVESKAVVSRHTVELVVVLLGTAADAEATRGRLTRRVERAAGVKPSLEVVAVPDATAFAGLESTLLTARPMKSARVQADSEQIVEAAKVAKAAIVAAWPESAAGSVLAVATESADESDLRFRVAHLGPALEPAALEAVTKAVTLKLGHPARIVDLALSSEPLVREGNDFAFTQRVAALAERASLVPEVTLCLQHPPAQAGKRASEPNSSELMTVFDTLARRLPNAQSYAGDGFEARLVRGACRPPSGDNSAGAPSVDSSEVSK